jgi:hypothetical protein
VVGDVAYRLRLGAASVRGLYDDEGAAIFARVNARQAPAWTLIEHAMVPTAVGEDAPRRKRCGRSRGLGRVVQGVDYALDQRRAARFNRLRSLAMELLVREAVAEAVP